MSEDDNTKLDKYQKYSLWCFALFLVWVFLCAGSPDIIDSIVKRIGGW